MFKDYLGGKRTGRVTKYPEDSLQVFQRISGLYADGKITTEIEDILRAEMPRVIDIDQDSSPATLSAMEISLQVADSFKEMMDKVTASMEIIADQKSIIESQQEDIRKLKTAFVLLARNQKKIKQLPSSAPIPELDEIRQSTEQLVQKDAELEEMALGLSFDTSDLKAKLQIMESELVRLRKDRRELEKHLQEKIDRLKQSQ